VDFFSPDNLRSICGGTWLARAPDGRAVQGISTDTRTLRPGEAYLALRGERLDGHRFLEAALAAGSSLLIVDDSEAGAAAARLPGASQAGILRVHDTARALLRLGAACRRTLDSTRVIAVAGSNGKTTTTRLIHAVLSSSLRGSTSPKSFNNAVGVPLTILGASPGDQYLVCEIGTNAPGEIAQLAAVVEPDIAVITSIGREHLEGLGSLEGVAKEEASLLSYLRPGGLAVATADTPLLAEYLKCVPNVVTFGRCESADLRIGDVRHEIVADGRVGVSFTINGRLACTLPIAGEHNALNAAAAYAVGRRLGLDEDRIFEALASARAPDMRLQPLRIAWDAGADSIVINDAYNANPDSMLAALAAFESICDALEQGRGRGGPAAEAEPGAGGGRRIVILGDMLELGDAGPAAHREIADRLLNLRRLDLVVLVGHLTLHTAHRLAEAGWEDDRMLMMSDLASGQPWAVAARLRPGDLVLLKGSRRMGLERILDALRERAGRPVPTAARR
jgi:UDP-N-acetylmuramoyl-tripeptide--D-alanyl-D-alanine ligase